MQGGGQFLIAFGVAFMLRFLSGLFLEGGWLREPSMAAWQRIPVTVGLPLAVAGVVLLVLHRVSPRRLFDPRVRRPWTLWVLGLGAGLAAAVLAAAPMRWMESVTAKAVVTGLLSGVAALAIALLLPRRRPYACVHCGAVLAEDERVCPGCGEEDSRGDAGSREPKAA